MPELQDLKSQLAKLLKERKRRAEITDKLTKYDESGCPIPKAIVTARLTKAYEVLVPMAEAPWGSLIVDSVQDRLEVAGIRSGDKAADEAAWGLWQDNRMDAESKLGHRSALLDGRSFATIWPVADGKPEISLDSAEQMVVMYREGSRYHRVAALRYWVDDDNRKHCTLYRPEGLYKFSESKEKAAAPDRIQAEGVWWERRVEKLSPTEDESWPVKNPYDVVPVVELAVNRRLRPGSFGYARGEFEHCTGLLDRINLLTFLGLVVALWMGFPLRGVIGDKVLRDDDGNPLAPFDSKPDTVIQLENPEAKVIQLNPADRSNLSIFAELDQLAAVTKTPRHYFPIGTGISNIAEPTIRAFEGALHAKTSDHKGSLGEGHEEVLRVGGRMLEEAVDLSPRAELLWKDHESRSMAERADAATKVASIEGIPPLFVAEKFLNLSQEELSRIEGEVGGAAILKLLEEARTGAATPPGEQEPVAA